MYGVRGELVDFGRMYSSPSNGSGKMAASVDPSQLAAAVQMVRVATDSMQSQFGAHLTVFSDVG
ncbi:MAG: hypothetical protein HQL32_08375 [Planctomycetes bacterium]|nr:hypothetical protein [Planctomycetota bacterium]